MHATNLLVIAALHVSLAFGAGCAVSPDAGDDDPEALASAQQELNPALVHVSANGNAAVLSYGYCDGDGYTIQDGKITRLGAAAGTDVTGITAPSHLACHNTAVWTQGVMYVCESNHGTHPAGTYSGAVPEFDEFVGGSLVHHPASVATHGLNFAHARLLRCDTASHQDYKLYSVECCAAPATP